jgi:hypothetical protein
MNFGYPGVLLSTFLTGLFLKMMVEYKRTNAESKYVLFFYGVAMMSSFGYIRADSSTFLKTYMIATWLPAICILLFMNRRQKSSKAVRVGDIPR